MQAARERRQGSGCSLAVFSHTGTRTDTNAQLLHSRVEVFGNAKGTSARTRSIPSGSTPRALKYRRGPGSGKQRWLLFITFEPLRNF